MLEVLTHEPVSAFLDGAARLADQAAQGAVAGTTGRQGDELEIVAATQLRTDDQLQPMLFGGDVGTHDARERALVGERKRAVPERLGLQDELLGLRGAAQEGEITERMEFGVHGMTPSSEQAVQIPALRMALLKNPQLRPMGRTHAVIIPCDALTVPPAAFDAFRILLQDRVTAQ